MNTPYPTSFSPASNATRILHAPMPTNIPQFVMPTQLPAQHYPIMMMPAPMQPQHHQLQMPNHGYPMYAFPTHNVPQLSFRPQFFPINQLPVTPSPQISVPQQFTPNATPTTSRSKMHNTSLNASLLGSSTSFNDSVRYNPLAGRGNDRCRNHSLLIDQTTSSSDRSLQQSIDTTEMANNNELINYCITELCRKPLTEQELVAKVSKSRRFRKFGLQNLPVAVSIILNTFPCFVSRTMIFKTNANDLQPISKTLWKSDKRYQKPRGNKLNLTMFEIPERSSGNGEVLSVLGDIASLNLDENQPPTTIASMEKVLEGIKV